MITLLHNCILLYIAIKGIVLLDYSYAYILAKKTSPMNFTAYHGMESKYV